MLVARFNVPIAPGDVTIYDEKANHLNTNTITNVEWSDTFAVTLPLTAFGTGDFNTLGAILTAQENAFRAVVEDQERMPQARTMGLFPDWFRKVPLDRTRCFVRLGAFPHPIAPLVEGVDMESQYWHTDKLNCLKRAVFQDSKLTERILLRLPMQDILSCRSTCKISRQAINASRRIQQKIFLEPLDWTMSGAAGRSMSTPDVHLNPIFFSKKAIKDSGGQLIIKPTIKHHIHEKESSRNLLVANLAPFESIPNCLKMSVSRPFLPGMEFCATWDNGRKLTPLITLEIHRATLEEAFDMARSRGGYHKFSDLRVLVPEGIRLLLDGESVEDIVAGK